MKSTQYKNLLEENKSGAGEFAVVEGLHAIKHALRFEATPHFILIENREELNSLIQKLCPDVKLKLESFQDKIKEVGAEFQNKNRRCGFI